MTAADLAARLQSLLADLQLPPIDAPPRLTALEAECLAVLRSSDKPLTGAAVWARLARTLDREKPYGLHGVYRALRSLATKDLVVNHHDGRGYEVCR